MDLNTGDSRDIPVEGVANPVISAGDFLFMPPRCGRWNTDTRKKNTTIETQTTQCLRKMRRFIEAMGASSKEIIHITVLLKSGEDIQAMDEAYCSFFGIGEKLPARTVIVTHLPDADMLVQMQCTAYHPTTCKV